MNFSLVSISLSRPRTPDAGPIKHLGRPRVICIRPVSPTPVLRKLQPKSLLLPHLIRRQTQLAFSGLVLCSQSLAIVSNQIPISSRV